MRGILIGGVALLIAIIGLTAAVDPGTDRQGPASTEVSTAYGADVLNRATTMTQRMSVSGPVSGHEYHDHDSDEQLRLAIDQPAFASDVTAYQSRLNRMLGSGS